LCDFFQPGKTTSKIFFIFPEFGEIMFIYFKWCALMVLKMKVFGIFIILISNFLVQILALFMNVRRGRLKPLFRVGRVEVRADAVGWVTRRCPRPHTRCSAARQYLKTLHSTHLPQQTSVRAAALYFGEKLIDREWRRTTGCR
jgi:hypothetical protein